jgi:hypothetical protein
MITPAQQAQVNAMARDKRYSREDRLEVARQMIASNDDPTVKTSAAAAVPAPAPEYFPGVVAYAHSMDWQNRTTKAAPIEQYDRNVRTVSAWNDYQGQAERAKAAAVTAPPVVRKSEARGMQPSVQAIDYARDFTSSRRTPEQQAAIDARYGSALVVAGRSCVL